MLQANLMMRSTKRTMTFFPESKGQQLGLEPVTETRQWSQ